MRCGKSLEATVALGVPSLILRAPLVSPILRLGFLLGALLICVVVSGSETTELQDCSVSWRPLPRCFVPNPAGQDGTAQTSSRGWVRTNSHAP